jgi:hypothetical protein
LYSYYHSSNYVTQCQSSSGTTGSVFITSLTVNYPNGCNSFGCQQRVQTTAMSALSTSLSTPTISATFTNGQTLSFSSVYCSANQTNSSESSIYKFETKEIEKYTRIENNHRRQLCINRQKVVHFSMKRSTKSCDNNIIRLLTGSRWE